MKQIQQVLLISFLFLAIFFDTAKAQCTVAINSTTTGSASSSASSLTISHTVAGSNTILIVRASTLSSDPSSVSWNGTNMTKLASNNGSTKYASIWYMINPASGTHNVIINGSSGFTPTVGVTSFTGVRQTSPFGSVSSGSFSGSSPSLTVSSATGEMVLDVVNISFSPTVGSGQTQQYNVSGSFFYGAGSTEAGASSVTMSWSAFSPSGSQVVASLRPCTATALVASAGVDKLICNGAGVAIGGSPTASGGTSPYTYSWSPSTGLSSSTVANPTASPTSTTNYTVTVTDAGGSTAADIMVVTVNAVPTVNTGGSHEICSGSSIAIGGSPTSSGGTSPYTYAWSPTTGLSSSTVANPTASPTSTTNYSVTVTDNNGCSKQSTVAAVVTVNPLATVSAGSNQNICTGSSVSIGGSPTASGGTSPYTYSWSPSTALSSTTVANPSSNPTSTITYTVTVTDNKGCTKASSVTVTVNPLPTANAGADKNICSGSSTSIGGSPTASGGTSPYTYAWTPTTGLNSSSTANPTANPTSTTNYSVTVTDNKGCTHEDIVIVNVTPSPTVSAGSNQTICPGASVTIGGSPTASGGTSPYNYAWTPTTGLNSATLANPTASPTSTTSYTVTVTDSTGCTKASTVVITVNPVLTVNAGGNLDVCTGSTLAIGGSPTASGGTSPYTYDWSPSTALSSTTVANPNSNPTSTITYTVIVTDNIGCTKASTVTVTVNPLPTANAGTDKIICSGSSTSIGGSPTASGGTSPYTYAWAPTTGLSSATSANPTADPTTTTSYTVTVSDNKGCTHEDIVVVTVNTSPTVSAGSNQTICSGATVSIGGSPTASGGTSPYTYSWSPSTALSSTTVANPTSNPTSTITYTVTVTDNIGCTKAASVTVTVNPLPTTNAGADKNICSGSSTSIGGSPTASGGTSPYTYAWSPTTGLNSSSSANPTANPTTTTSYTVTVTDNKGCTHQDIVIVNVNPSLTVSAGSNQTICNGASVTIGDSPTVSGGTSPYTYAWTPTTGLSSPTVANPTANPTSTTSYTVTVTDNTGCSKASTAVITVNPLPTANAGADRSLCLDSTIVIGGSPTASGGTSPYTYSWNPTAGLSSATIANPTATPSVTTDYTVTVTDNKGCAATDIAMVTVGSTTVTLTSSATGNQVCQGNSITFTASPSGYGHYKFYKNGVNVQTGTSNTYALSNPSNNDKITVSVLDSSKISIINQPCVQLISTTSGFANSTATSLTVSHTVSGSNTFLMVRVSSTSSNPTSVTWNGTSMSSSSSGSNGNFVSFWYLVNPASGTHNVVVNGASGFAPVVGVSSFTGVKQSGPLGSTSTGSFTNSSPSKTVSSSTSALVVDVVKSSTSLSPGANQTAQYSINGTGFFGGGSSEPGASSVTMSWTGTGSGAYMAVSINAVTGCVPGTSVVYTDCPYGRSDTINVIVNPIPTVTVSPNTTICSGASTNLTASGATTYVWTPATGLSSSTDASVTANPTTTTSYSVTGITNGCTAIATVVVTVNPSPTVTVSPDTIICNGTSINLTASGAATYVWSPATGLSSSTDASVTASPITTTSYSVTGTNANGCSDIAVVIITVNPNPTASFTVGGTHVFPPAIEWSKNYGGSSYDFGNTIAKTSDGGYIFSGYSYSNDGDVSGNHGYTDYMIMKLDVVGNIEWQKSVGGSDYDQANLIMQDADGGYTVFGLSASNDGDFTGFHGGGGDIGVVKINSVGTVLWTKMIGGSGDDWAYNSKKTSDGGYIVTGQTTSSDGDITDANHGEGDGMVIKLDSLGNVLWQKCFGTATYDFLTDVIETNSGDFIVSGVTTPNVVDDQDLWVMKLSSTGTMIWQKIYGGTGHEEIRGITKLEGGGYAITGGSESSDGDIGTADGSYNIWTIKIDESGNIVWKNLFGGSGVDASEAALKEADGGCVVTGFTNSQDAGMATSGGTDGVLLKINGSGETVWHGEYGGINNERYGNALATPDGGYIVVSDYYSSSAAEVAPGRGLQEALIIKLTAPYTGACVGSTLAFTGTSTNATTYQWKVNGSNAGSNESLSYTFNTAGTFTVSLFAINGICTDTAAAVVVIKPLPTVTVNSAADSICSGTSTVLTAGGAKTYSWAPAAGLSSTTGAVVTASPVSTTSYTVTGTDENGCINIANVIVTVHQQPLADAGHNSAISAGGSVIIGGDPTATDGVSPYIYLWSPATGLNSTSIANPLASPATITQYSLTVTDSNGCIATSIVEVSIYGTPLTDAGEDTTICEGGAVELHATGAETYTWFPEMGLSDVTISNPIASPLETITYYVIGTIGDTSVLDSVKVIVRSEPSLTLSNTLYKICPGQSAMLYATGAGTFLWTPSEGLSDDVSASPSASPTVSTGYMVTLTDTSGCTTSDRVDVIVVSVLVTTPNELTLEMGKSIRLIATSNTENLIWTPITALDNPTSISPLASPTTAITYTVTGTLEGCSSQSTVLVSIIESPRASFAYSFPGLEVQFTNDITIADTYTWDFGDGSNSNIANPQHTYANEGSYNVCLTVTNIFGTANYCEEIDVQLLQQCCD